MKVLRDALSRLRRYPSAFVGLAVVLGLVGISIYAVVSIPYAEAVALWRGEGNVWREYPRNASPAWTNWFRAKPLPETIRIGTGEPGIETEVLREWEGGRRLGVVLPVDFPAGEFPSEMNLFLEAAYEETLPHVKATWHTPDGREIDLGRHRVEHADRVAISQDPEIRTRFGGRDPHVGLFAAPGEGEPKGLPGRYELHLEVVLFEPDASVDARLVVYGRVHGIAGTDHRRRDLRVALLWGTPVAMAFGLLATVGTTVATLLIAAIGVWFGGLVDAAIQRLTEVNMVLPLLPLLVMIGTLYSSSIWLMLGTIVLLGIFSGSIKTYRAMLLPMRNAPYIEAARAYGAGNTRIVLRYLTPRVLPVLIPSFVMGIPSFVFLEAALAVLGLGDPVLPTWGKVLNDAQVNGALWQGQYYWVLEPAALLMLTGLGFAMLGFALDRVFNPRLREI